MSNMKLGTKLIVSFLLVGILPFAVIALLSLNKASDTITMQAYNQLTAIQAIKTSQISNYFTERMGDASVLAGNPTVAEALENFSAAFEAENDKVGGDLWNAVEEEYSEWLTQYNNEYGYYDLFLIHSDGAICYTVAAESDMGMNATGSVLSSSSLGKCFKNALNGVAMADFQPYAPSNGDPCSFVGAPVKKDGKTIGVVALQLPLGAINAIMQERTGMGETGETYLVGSDKLMRSDSFLDPANHTVNASFANPGKGSVNTDATSEALSGKTDAKIITDYNGNPVLSAFAPLKVGDLTWAIIAEIDESEAFATVKSLKAMMMIIGLIGIAGIILTAVWMTRSITKPVNKVIEGLTDGANQVTSAAGQVSSSSQSLAEGTSEQASSLEEVSSSLEEMTSMTKQNAENAKQADSMADDTSVAAEKGSLSMQNMEDAINKIKESSDETAKIIKTIDEIAFQTNLLALNAAVEAARAGEAGMGFAVVAEEVRNLAQRSAEAAKDTAELIEGSQTNTENGVRMTKEVSEILKEIAGSSKKVKQLVSEVSSASEEQAQGIEQVNTAITQMDKVTQSSAANAEESASASEELSAQAVDLNNMVEVLINIVGGSSSNGNGAGMIKGRPSAKIAAAPKKQSKVHAMLNKKNTPVTVSSNEDFIPLDDSDFEEF